MSPAATIASPGLGESQRILLEALKRRGESTLAELEGSLDLAAETVRSHLQALRRMRTFEDVRVWSPRSAQRFAAEHGVRAAGSAEEAVRDADVVVVATSSKTPVLQGKWLAPGTHVNAVGACRPDWRELDDELVRSARLFVEARDAASKESGDVIAKGAIDAEMGEVIGGKHPGRTGDGEITLFKSVGMAVEDLVAAQLALDAADASRRGAGR